MDIGAYEYQGAPGASQEAASTIVTTLDDVADAEDGVISLREAIVHATLGALGTAVTFDGSLAGGTIVLGGMELFIYDSVDVDATSIGGMTIDAAGGSRVMYITDSDTDVALSGLEIAGGNTAFYGGGIYNYKSTLTLLNVTVSGNTADCNGGGIYNNSGTLTL